MALKRNYKRNYKRNDAGFCYVTVQLWVSMGVDFMPSPFPGMNPYYDILIDYSRDPLPGLPSNDAVWMDG